MLVQTVLYPLRTANIQADNFAMLSAFRKIVKKSCLWVAISRFRTILSVSVFRGPLFVDIIKIDGSVKREP